MTGRDRTDAEADDDGEGEVDSPDSPDSSDCHDSAPSPTVAAVGAATLDRTYAVTNLPEPDGGAYARDVTAHPGGVGANVAAGCARLGREAGLVARLGDDDVGERVAADLDESPVDDARIRTGSGTTTHCVVLRDGDGERMIVTAGNSTRRLRLNDRDEAYLRGADAVFVTAYTPDAVTARLAELASEPSFPPLVVDLSGPLEELQDRGTEPETLGRLCRVAALFVANEVAAESYLGCPAADAPAALRDRGVDRGVVTYGVDGATLFAGDREASVPAFNVTVTDTTGAGDAFTAGLVDRWLLGDADPRAAGRWAAACAALNCRVAGARDGLPTAAAVESFLAESERD
ncbi:MAG: carbohydrate kinase family protein [Halolamina sp.]